MFRSRNVLFFSTLLFVSTSSILADWIDDLAVQVSQEGQWKTEYAQVLDKYISQDDEKIKQIEKKTDALKSDIWSKLKYAAYYVELNSAKSEKKFHQKVAQVLSELHENKNNRERLVKNLISLNNNNLELEKLNNTLNESKETGDKIKINLQIAAKKTEIGAKKAFIRGLIII